MPLVVFEQLDEDDDEADELDGVEDEAHGEGDLTQGCQVVILTLITKKVRTNEWSPAFCNLSTPYLRCIQCHVVDMTLTISGQKREKWGRGLPSHELIQSDIRQP